MDRYGNSKSVGKRRPNRERERLQRRTVQPREAEVDAPPSEWPLWNPEGSRLEREKDPWRDQLASPFSKSGFKTTLVLAAAGRISTLSMRHSPTSSKPICACNIELS